MKVSFIGAGNMGGAIVKGFCLAGVFKPEELFVADASEQTLKSVSEINSSIFTSTSNKEVAKGADYIIIAVKPWLMDVVLEDIKPVLTAGQTIVSIAAGVDLSHIAEVVGNDKPLFRVLPNTAVALLAGMNFVSALNASKEQEEFVLGIFNKLGLAISVPESQMGAFTSVSSCGIAYALRYLRAATQGAVELGIRPDIAQEVIAQTMIGAAELILKNKSNAEAEIDKVTTPGGWTIKGLNAMEQNGFSNAVIQGIKANR